MSADDATTDTLAGDTDPTTHSKRAPPRQTSSPTRQTAAYWSMQRTMNDIS